MRRLLIGLIFSAVWIVSANADPVGTIVHADGTMTAIYEARGGRAYVVQFDKNGNATTGCTRESMAAFQARKAYMQAKSQWRAGYIPQNHSCFH